MTHIGNVTAVLLARKPRKETKASNLGVDRMSKKLVIGIPCLDHKLPRIGGGALIGHDANWPLAPDGTELTLVMSIPAPFLNQYAGFELPSTLFVSVFSYYSQTEYFLDSITYHGSEDELAWLRKGFTKVIVHEAGEEVFGPIVVPAMCLEIEDDGRAETNSGVSRLGGHPGLLQAQPLDLGNQQFALQLYGGNFPQPYNGIFGLSDAVGYLFIDSSAIGTSQEADAGTFFVQVT